MNLGETKIHFVGIGGIGMSGIAEVLVNMGCRVTGSDLSDNTQVERLRAMGVVIHRGHLSKNLPHDCDAVVFSSAVKMNNPEIIEAKKRHIPVIQRAEMLAELMGLKRGIAIGGTHGKTTTTSMVATVLIGSGFDPTVVIGGRLDLIKSTAALGKGAWFVAEADESDGSFLKLAPELAVITNIDNDHLDHYGGLDYGSAILCTDDKNVARLAAHFPKRFMSYGQKSQARLRFSNLKCQDGRQTFLVSLDNKNLGSVTLSVPGVHNIYNALAAMAVGLELQIPFASIARSLSEYHGVDRRLQKRGECGPRYRVHN